jgi:hypothetical protein
MSFGRMVAKSDCRRPEKTLSGEGGGGDQKFHFVLIRRGIFQALPYDARIHLYLKIMVRTSNSYETKLIAIATIFAIILVRWELCVYYSLRSEISVGKFVLA